MIPIYLRPRPPSISPFLQTPTPSTRRCSDQDDDHTWKTKQRDEPELELGEFSGVSLVGVSVSRVTEAELCSF